MGVAVDLSARAAEKIGIERKRERVSRARKRDIKQTLHFLTLSSFKIIFHIGHVAVIERNLRLFAVDDARIRAGRRESRFARKKWNDHRVPFRSFRLVRGNQLNRVRLGRLGLTDLVEVAAKREPKIGQRLLLRFRRSGCA